MKLILILFVIALGSISLASAQEFEDLGVKVETVAENLKVPWSIAFAPDGRIFFTERGGDLRVIEDGNLNPNPVTNFDVSGGEGGLLGVALDPNFEENHYLYLYYSYSDFLTTYNKVVRFTEDNNSLSEETVLIDKIPGAAIHDGGRIKFGSDGLLYITTGDAADTKLSQDVNSLAGKILRINSDGTIPEDNPFGSAIFSLGHRNPQGLDWHPDSGILVATEHGPSGERGFAHDEVNVIESGKNYGWPDVIGDETGPEFTDPIIHTGDDTWAPSGAGFYDSQNISDWYGKYFVATLRGNHLRVLDFDFENNQVISSQAIFSGEFGRLRDASMGSDGNLYLLTSNQDGRGSPAANDDRILRIVPIMSGMKMGDSSLSPKDQISMGIDPHMVQCKEGFELIFKDKVWSPACVKPSSIERLIEIGWASDHDPYHHGINNPK